MKDFLNVMLYSSRVYEKGLQKESDLVFNRYKNSAYYVDSQIAKIVNEIEKSGKMENTI